MAVSRIDEAGLNVTQYGNRNLVINGAMTISQRATSVTGVTETNGYKTVDRFQFWTYSGGTYSLSQDSTAPSGFGYSHKVSNTATTSTVAGTGVSFRQRIEAQNLQQLAYNTADAKDVTLSFWVRSTATGTWAVRIYNPDSGRIVTKTYAISSANTWEYKSITFSGDTSGAINNDTGYAFEIVWWLAAGTDFTSGTPTGDWETYSATKEASGQTVQLNTGGDWYITGVQLEVGDTATGFEHRSYGDELARCQRYFTKIYAKGSVQAYNCFPFTGYCRSTTLCQITIHWNQRMRAVPTMSYSGASDFGVVDSTGSTRAVSAINTSRTTDEACVAELTASSLGAGNGTRLLANNTADPFIIVDAEL